MTPPVAQVTSIVPVTTPTGGAELYRASTDAAGLCKAIVLKTALAIDGKKYVKVEGWQSIAIAHGCVASSGDVERVNDPECPGFKATGKVVRMDTGAVIATAEGFVGDDEKVWKNRPAYARRSMAQTRAISRACRSAFAHVVVMMDAGLETTPAEEVPAEGFEAKPTSIKAAKEKVRSAARVVDAELVDGSDYRMPFASKDGHWEKAAPISSVATEHLQKLASWKGARDDLREAVEAELSRRASEVRVPGVDDAEGA